MAVTKKATTKAPVRKKTTPVSSKSSIEETAAPRSSTPTPRKSLKIRKSYLVIGLGIIVLAALLYVSRSLFIAAIVNGQPITRLSLIQQLEKQGGKQVLNVAVTKTLIEQEARKQNVTVSQKEIDDELKKTEQSLASQGQTLDQALAAQGMTRADYADQIRLQQLIQKMVGKDITVSEKEVNDYIETNRASIPEGSDMEQIKKSVEEQLKQQKLSTKIQSWIAELQKNAKINYFIEY